MKRYFYHRDDYALHVFQGELSFFESYDQATGAESLEKKGAF